MCLLKPSVFIFFYMGIISNGSWLWTAGVPFWGGRRSSCNTAVWGVIAIRRNPGVLPHGYDANVALVKEGIHLPGNVPSQKIAWNDVYKWMVCYFLENICRYFVGRSPVVEVASISSLHFIICFWYIDLHQEESSRGRFGEDWSKFLPLRFRPGWIIFWQGHRVAPLGEPLPPLNVWLADALKNPVGEAFPFAPKLSTRFYIRN